MREYTRVAMLVGLLVVVGAHGFAAKIIVNVEGENEVLNAEFEDAIRYELGLNPQLQILEEVDHATSNWIVMTFTVADLSGVDPSGRIFVYVVVYAARLIDGEIALGTPASQWATAFRGDLGSFIARELAGQAENLIMQTTVMLNLFTTDLE